MSSCDVAEGARVVLDEVCGLATRGGGPGERRDASIGAYHLLSMFEGSGSGCWRVGKCVPWASRA